MKDGHGEAFDSKYSIVPSGSGSCLYVKGKALYIKMSDFNYLKHRCTFRDLWKYAWLIFIEIPSTTSTTPTQTTTVETSTAVASGTTCDT